MAKNGRGPTPKTALVVRRTARGDVVSTSYSALALQTGECGSYYSMKRANTHVYVFQCNHVTGGVLDCETVLSSQTMPTARSVPGTSFLKL